MRMIFVLATLVFGALVVPPAVAQDSYPSKPLRILVPFAPGGGIDILGRTLGQKLQELPVKSPRSRQSARNSAVCRFGNGRSAFSTSS